MAKPKKKKKKKGGLHPKAVKLLVDLVRSPGDTDAKAGELEKFNLNAAELKDALTSAHAISEDPDDSGSMDAFHALPYSVKLALLEVVAEEGAAGFLARLKRDVEDKGVAKAVGAAINKLRADGMDVPDLTERSGVSFDAVAEPPPQNWVTAIDGDGNRIVIFAQPGGRGLNVFYAMCGDTEGLQHIEGVAMPRGAYRRFVRTVEAQVNAQMIPVDDLTAIWLIDDARKTSAAAGNPLPNGYDEAKSILTPPAGERPGPAIWEIFDRAELAKAEDLIADSGKLHELHEFVTWAPDEPGLEVLMEEVTEAKEKGKGSDDDKLASAVDKTVKRWFDDETNRQRIVRRLEENAFVLHVSERIGDARSTAAVAAALANPKADANAIPFARQIFDKVAGALPEELPAAADAPIPAAPEVPEVPEVPEP